MDIGIILQSDPSKLKPFQEFWPALLQPYDPFYFIESLYRLWLYVLKTLLIKIRMNRPTPIPGHSSKTAAETPKKEPVVSPIEKTIRKLKPKGGFGVFDRKTKTVFACYRDSIKYSVFALLGTVIAVVS